MFQLWQRAAFTPTSRFVPVRFPVVVVVVAASLLYYNTTSVFFVLSSGRLVKIKLKLTILPRVRVMYVST